MVYRLFKFLHVSLHERKFGPRWCVIWKTIWGCEVVSFKSVQCKCYCCASRAQSQHLMHREWGSLLHSLGRAQASFPRLSAPASQSCNPGELQSEIVLPFTWHQDRDWPCHSSAFCLNQIIKLSSRSEMICHSLSVLELTWSVIYFPRQRQCRYTMLIHLSRAQQRGWEKNVRTHKVSGYL